MPECKIPIGQMPTRGIHAQRQTALDNIPSVSDLVEHRNPLFSKFTGIFDDVFRTQGAIPADEYVKRRSDAPDYEYFEDRLATLLFSGHENVATKMYFLVGDVGHGKTALAHFLCHDVLPAQHPGFLGLYINAYRQLSGDAERNLDAILLSELEKNLIPSLYSSTWELHRAIARAAGATDPTDMFVVEYRKQISRKDILSFIHTIDSVTHVLIIIDNIDDHSRVCIDHALAYAKRLDNELAGNIRKRFCIFVPVRRYTQKPANATEHYPQIDLPRLNTFDLLSTKLNAVKERLSKSFAPGFVLEVEPSWQDYSRARGPQAGGARWKIDASNFGLVLRKIIELLAASPETPFVTYVRGISGGNGKMVTRNGYYVFHSGYFPLADVAREAFSNPETKEYMSARHDTVPWYSMIHCLMAIHTPYYDKRSSKVLNIFNCIDSREPKDYRNTLVIFRLLALLVNWKNIRFGEMISHLSAHGYSEEYIKAACSRLLEYDLLSTEHGVDVDHFDLSTPLDISEVGWFYVDKLILSGPYLQYACEDTPMESKFVVPLVEKYGKTRSNKAKRKLDSKVKMWEFIKLEELREKEWLINNGISTEAFLSEMSLDNKWLYYLMEMNANFKAYSEKTFPEGSPEA